MLEIPDINGIELEDANEIVLGYTVTLKKTVTALNDAKTEQKTWIERIALAKSHNREDLAGQAQQQVTLLDEKIATLQMEINELEPVVKRLKQNLHMLKTGATLNYDVDHLSAEIEVMMGDDLQKEQTKQEINSLSIDDELRAMKEQMEKEGKKE